MLRPRLVFSNTSLRRCRVGVLLLRTGKECFEGKAKLRQRLDVFVYIYFVSFVLGKYLKLAWPSPDLPGSQTKHGRHKKIRPSRPHKRYMSPKTWNHILCISEFRRCFVFHTTFMVWAAIFDAHERVKSWCWNLKNRSRRGPRNSVLVVAFFAPRLN